MPGPPVVVCQGDDVLVDVYNRMPGDSTSIHFHGKFFCRKERHVPEIKTLSIYVVFNEIYSNECNLQENILETETNIWMEYLT